MPQPRDLLNREPVAQRANPKVEMPAPTGEDPSEDSSETPTPEEQEFFDQLSAKAEKMIFGPMSDKLIKRMNHPDEPVYENVGQAAAMIGKILVGHAKSAGKEIHSVSVLAAGADHVIPMLFELAEAAGILPEMSDEEEQEQMELALYAAEKAFGESEIAEGTSPQAEAQQEMDMQLQKEGAGTFNDMVNQAGMQPPENDNMPQFATQDPMSAGVQQANRSLV